MNRFNLPDDPKLAGKIIDGDRSAQADNRRLGFLGKIFGDHQNSSGNIASLVVVCGLVVFSIILIYGIWAKLISATSALSAASNLITLALGYLFGKSRA